MAGEIQFTEQMKRENLEAAEEWRDTHNYENPETEARFDVLPNGNVRVYVTARDREQAIKEAERHSTS